jgi:hypothetical protein
LRNKIAEDDGELKIDLAQGVYFLVVTAYIDLNLASDLEYSLKWNYKADGHDEALYWLWNHHRIYGAFGENSEEYQDYHSDFNDGQTVTLELHAINGSTDLTSISVDDRDGNRLNTVFCRGEEYCQITFTTPTSYVYITVRHNQNQPSLEYSLEWLAELNS